MFLSSFSFLPLPAKHHEVCVAIPGQNIEDAGRVMCIQPCGNKLGCPRSINLQHGNGHPIMMGRVCTRLDVGTQGPSEVLLLVLTCGPVSSIRMIKFAWRMQDTNIARIHQHDHGLSTRDCAAGDD